MAKKYKINRSNYTLKTRHQLTSGGTVFERDFMTTTNLGAWDSGSIPYGESNFRMFYRETENARRKSRPGTWLLTDAECSSGRPEYWSYGCILRSGVTEEKNIIAKPNYNSLLDFAYFGSCRELIRSTVEKIIRTFPGEAVLRTSDAFTFDDGEFHLLSNPFGIDFFDTKKASGIKDFIKNAQAYAIFSDEFPNGAPVNGNATVNRNFSACTYGDTTKTVTINYEGGTVTVYEKISADGRALFAKYDGALSIRPSESYLSDFFDGLDDFGNLLLNRTSKPLYTALLDTPFETDYGVATYMRSYTWPVVNEWNLDVESSTYRAYLESLLNLADFYDERYTDNLWRMLTHDSIKSMDISYSNPAKDEDEEDYAIGATRLEGLLWAYGRQFDELKRAIDNVRRISNITYDGNANAPDYFLSDTLENSGWEVYNAVGGISETRSEQWVDDGATYTYTPEKANYEFLRMLKLNSKSILKKKGTKDGLTSLLGLFGLYPDTDYTIEEHVSVVQDGIETASISDEFEMERFNMMKASTPTSLEDVEYNELDGLPFTYVENGEEKYLIPWYDKNAVYDGGMYYQMNGGWERRNIFKTLFDGDEYEFSVANGDYTYRETIKNITVVDGLADMSAITQTHIYDGALCYVEDIYGLSDYFPDADDELSAPMWHYFILNNAENYDEISVDKGWCPANMYKGGEGKRLVTLAESIVDDYKANNPHNGHLRYDGGTEYIERFHKPFGYHVQRDMFRDIAYECDGKLISGITEYEIKITSGITDAKKVWYFSRETQGDTLSSTPVALSENAPYDTYDFESGSLGRKFTEASANSIINAKTMLITFHTNFINDFKSYLEASILPYLRQMIPSTVIWGYAIDGETPVAPQIRTYTVMIKNVTEGATVTINGQSAVFLQAEEGSEITWSVTKDYYNPVGGTFTLTGNTVLDGTLKPMYGDIIISATPNNALVIMNGEETDDYGAAVGTVVEYSVSAEGYITQTGVTTIERNGTTTIYVILERDTSVITTYSVTFIVKDSEGAILSNAKIKVNGKYLSGTIYKNANIGEILNYEVTCPHYEKVTGTMTVEGNETVNIEMTGVPSMTYKIYTEPTTTTIWVSDDFVTNKKLENGVIVTVEGEEWRKFEYETDEGQTVQYTASAPDRDINNSEEQG